MPLNSLVRRRPAAWLVVLAVVAACTGVEKIAGPLRAPIAPDALIASNPNNVYISQVYGGGGNAGATLKNDFIELYNGGSNTVDLTGWSVQYTSSTGATWTNLTKLSGSIAPGQYFLVQEAFGAGGTVALPTPDVVGTIAMSATAGKVALVSNSTALSGTGCPPSATVVDFVGYGTGTNCFEGTGPTAALANTTAALRKDGGRQDTDQNSADFTVGAPAPRNTSSPILPPLNAVMVTISPATPAVVTGATVNFTATAAKSGAASTITSAAWTSSNTAVATIDAATGVATTLSSGTTTIGVTVATSDGGASGTTTLTASAAPATVTLSPTTWSLKVAQTKQFTATSADAGGQPVTSTYTWSSADPAIATVSASGLATGVAVGATTISATTPNGKVGSATVTVTAAAGFLSVAARTTPLPVGFQTQLFLTGTGTDKNGKTITNADLLWSTADAATVSVEPSTGVITAKKVGSVVITATSTSDGATSGSTTITTNDPPVSATARVGHNTELGVPTDADPSDDVIIARRQYTMSYNASHAGPNWVSWNLDASHTGGSARCNCFTADTALTRLGITAYNTNDWVNGGIWSRGHMSPSADWADTDGDNAPTFFLSNMIPQNQTANSGAWGDLENYLRTLATGNAEIYIVAGPIFTKGRTNGKDGFGVTTGTGHIAVPDSMWKVAIVVPDGRSAAQITNPADVRVIAVNMPNEATSVGGWANFSTTIAKIQKSTGYDLLSALPERIQCTLESRACAPSARIAGAAGGIEGQTLTFDGSTSTDPNAGGTLTYQWSLNGQPLVGGTTPQISYGFADNGAYTLRLVTGDQFGLADTTTSTVTVTNAAPVVQPATATSVRARESLTLSASFSDAGVNDAPWNYVIHWGDGTGGEYATSGTTNTPGTIGGTHSYASAGTYTIHVDVTDKDGGVGSTQLHVTVDPAESTPVGTNVAVSPVDPTTGTQPVAISFATVSSGGVTTIASANTPPAATSAIQSSFSVASAVYYDIRTTATFSGAATVCVTYPAGTFAPGVQPALLHYNGTAWEDVTTSSNATTLTVCGSVTSFSPFAVVRRNSAPVVGSLANSSTIGQYSVRAAFTDSDGNDDGPWSWAITWGDGSAATTGTAASQSPIDAGHVFADPGNYTVTIVVTDRSGAASVAKTVSVHVFDTTPPVVSSAVSGTQGQNGWYTSDVTVRWTTSARSPITTPACADNVLTTDTPSATFTCTTTSEGGTTTKTVIVARDATNPVVSYAGNAGSYTVDQAVSITCSASDATSGLASNGCADVSGAGYTFALGTTSFSATAVDRAGNSASASGSFTMRATSGSVCALVERWTSKQGVANSLCVKLTHGDVGAFRNEVSAQSGKAIDADKAAILTKLADAL